MFFGSSKPENEGDLSHVPGQVVSMFFFFWGGGILLLPKNYGEMMQMI